MRPALLPGDTRVTRKRAMFEADAQGEIVALCVETGILIGFNDSASEIWRMIATPRTVDELLAELTRQYAVTETDCARDLSAALWQMQDEDLVTLEQA